MAKQSKAVDNVIEKSSRQFPRIVNTPHKNAAIYFKEESPKYFQIIKDYVNNPRGFRDKEEYKDFFNKELKSPHPRYLHTEGMARKARRMAEEDGWRVSDEQGRYLCQTEEQAVFILLYYFSVDKYLRRDWPYGQILYLDRSAPKLERYYDLNDAPGELKKLKDKLFPHLMIEIPECLEEE